MLVIVELIGVFLVGYGIWFAGEGLKQLLNGAKDWWRPIKGKRRYPYPVSGVLLGICFVCMGLVFALNNVWANARILAFVGIGIFCLVVFAGIVQPRFLHPVWYGRLEDRFGKKGVLRLRRAALETEEDDWREIVASEASFDEWVNRTMPGEPRRAGRGYKKDTGGT
jgi:hypothetical protein